MPVLFTTIDLGDAAGEVHFQVANQGAGNGAHARRADPAGLLVWRRAELAALKVVELRCPLGDPAVGLPALHFSDKAPVAGGEILRPHVECASVAAFARHAPTAATAFIEQLHDVAGLLQSLGGGESGDAGADNCDG
ncbi:hypothetical protein D3C81_1616950 [compost metagenome]